MQMEWAWVCHVVAEMAPPPTVGDDETTKIAAYLVLGAVGLLALWALTALLRRMKPPTVDAPWELPTDTTTPPSSSPLPVPLADNEDTDNGDTTATASADGGAASATVDVDRPSLFERYPRIPHWGVAEFVMTVGVYVFALVVVSSVARGMGFATDSLVVAMSVNILAQFAGIGAAVAMVASLYRQPMLAILFPRGTWLKLWLKTGAIILAGWPVIAFLVAPIWQAILHGLLGHEPHMQDLVIRLRDSRGDWVLWGTAIITAVVVAPIAEEFAFRGLLYVGLRRHAGVWGGAVLSGLIFAGVHFNTFSFVPLFALGILLALTFEKTRNLAAPIAFHAVFNAITLILIQLGWE